MSTKSDGKSHDFNQIRELLESKFEEEFEAEQKLLRMERELRIKNQPSSDLISEEDPFIDPEIATVADLMKMLNLLSGRIGQLNRRMDTVQKEVEDVKSRVVRIERNMNDTLSTVEKVKDMVMASVNPDYDCSPVCEFEFETITEEEELHELETRLATDRVYVTNITNWLKRKITREMPDQRMLEAMDILFDRKFMPQCSWTGKSHSGPRIPLREQKHILELFREVGSTPLTAITAAAVVRFFKKKLRYAKSRSQQGSVRSNTTKPVDSDTDEDLIP